MGGYENRYLTLDWIHNFNNVSFDDALASALTEAEKQVQIMAEPISITTSNIFSEEDWGGIIDRFGYRTCYIPQGDRQPIKITFSEPYIVGVDMANTDGSVDEADIVYEDNEDCVGCAELDEFLDSLQKKCDEAV